MKRSAILLFTFLLSATGWSQKKTIELYDLLWALAPDSTSASSVVNWNSTAQINDFVSWETQSAVLQKGIYSRRGSVSVMINRKVFSCESKKGTCLYKISMEGTQNGYSKFSLDHTLTKDFSPGKTIDYLFNKPVKYNLYKKNADNGDIQLNTYEIKMDGKRPVWLMYATIISPQGNGIYIKCYATEESLKADEIKKPVDQSAEKLLPAAAALFKNVKTKLSNAEKNEIYKILGKEKGDETSVYPTDLNRDGIEEIFIRVSNFQMYGDDGRTMAFIKSSSGKYELQEEAIVGFLSARRSSSKGYPDLIAGGRGFKFSVFRWNGLKYAYYINNQSPVESDKDIEYVSEDYVKGIQSPAVTNSPTPVTPPIEKKTTTAPANNLTFLIEYNTSQKDIFSNKSFVARLKKLLGKEYNRMMLNWDLSTPVVIEKGLFYYWGMQAHNGGVHESMILADINNNSLYVNLLKDEKPYHFSEDGKNIIPAYLLNWGIQVSNRGK